MIDQLKDIKASETITINFFPYLFTIIGVILFITLILFVFIRKKKKLTPKQIAIQKLKSLDFENTADKQLAYNFCKYSYQCLEDNHEDEFKKIERQLESFKYKKEVPKLDSDLKSQMKDYIKVRL